MYGDHTILTIWRLSEPFFYPKIRSRLFWWPEKHIVLTEKPHPLVHYRSMSASVSAFFHRLVLVLLVQIKAVCTVTRSQSEWCARPWKILVSKGSVLAACWKKSRFREWKPKHLRGWPVTHWTCNEAIHIMGKINSVGYKLAFRSVLLVSRFGVWSPQVAADWCNKDVKQSPVFVRLAGRAVLAGLQCQIASLVLTWCNKHPADKPPHSYEYKDGFGLHNAFVLCNS